MSEKVSGAITSEAYGLPEATFLGTFLEIGVKKVREGYDYSD